MPHKKTNNYIRQTFKHNGFTLLEILMAITIFSVLSTISIKLLKSQTRLLKRSQSILTKNTSFINLSNYLSTDLNQLSMRSMRIGTTTEGPLIGWKNNIEFSRNGWVNYQGLKQGETIRISYKYEPTEKTITRNIFKYIDNKEKELFTTVIMIQDIDSYNVTYFDSTNMQYTQWPPEDNTIKNEEHLAYLLFEIESTDLGIFKKYFPIFTTEYETEQ